MCYTAGTLRRKAFYPMNKTMPVTFFHRSSLFVLLFGLLAIVPSSTFAFFDVLDTYPYNDAITRLTQLGILQGYPDGLFRPGQTINRAEMVKMLMKALSPGEQLSSCDIGNAFPDVRSSDWFAPYVCLMHKKGFIKGYPDGTFRPGNAINFVEFAKITANVLGLSGSTSVPPRQWYAPYVTALSDNNAIPLTIFSPDKPMNRGEVAEVLARLLYGSEGLSVSYKNALSVVYNGEFDHFEFGGYSRRFDGVISWGLAPITIADSQTFEIVPFPMTDPVMRNAFFAKDKNRAYARYITIEGSDPATFQSLSPDYAKDRLHAYYQQYRIPGVDLSSFEVVGKLARDSRLVYAGSGAVSGSNGPALHLLDSFQDDLASDGQHVFYNRKILPADAATFSILSDLVWKDKNKVFYDQQVIVGADPASFVLLTDGFSKDAKRVYSATRAVPDLDPTTFRILNTNYVSDRKGIYHFDYSDAALSPLIADPQTFKTFDMNPSAAIDASHVFYRGKTLSGFDPKTLEMFPCDFAKDSLHVYLFPYYTIQGIDPASATFVRDTSSLSDYCNGRLLQDKNGKYSGEEIGRRLLPITQ